MKEISAWTEGRKRPMGVGGKLPISSVGEVWMFPGITQYTFPESMLL
jgi:hypothetical protein